MSTSSPTLLGPVSNGPWGGPAMLDDSNLAPMSVCVDQMYRVNQQGTMACQVDQPSQDTRAWVRGPAGLTSCAR